MAGTEKNEKIVFVRKYILPALEQHAAGDTVTIKHPETEETLVITELPELGLLSVRTPQLGVIYRERRAKKGL